MMMMKMAAAFTITLFLLCCSIASTDSKESCDHYAATGGNFTVILDHKLDKSGRLKWLHNSKTIFDQRPNHLVTGKKEDVYENGSLKLTNLNKSHKGNYIPEVYNLQGQKVKDFKSIQLCILDAVPKPELTYDCSQLPVKLTCKVGQAGDPKTKWFQNNEVLKGKEKTTLTPDPKDLEKYSFRCEVFNAVSSSSSKSVNNPCYVNSNFFPKEILGINTWIVVGVGGGVVLLLIGIVIFCCIQTKRKKRLRLKDEGELRLAWTAEQQHLHNHPPNQHHHHHQQQQPAGHTGPRQQRSKQQRGQQRPRAPDHGHPQPSPRRPAQAPPKPVDNVGDEQPPPLPQPRKKGPKTQRV